MISKLGQQIRDGRRSAGLTQAQLAARTRLSRSAVRAIERGQARVSSLDQVLSALGLEIRGRQLSSGPIGKALAAARKNRKTSLRHLSAALGVSRNTLMVIERGGGLLSILEAYAAAVGAGLYLATPDAPRTFYSHAGNASAFNGWQTPADLAETLSQAVGGFDIDPCAATSDHRKARIRAKLLLTEVDDGMSVHWGVKKKAYVNPPYNRSLGKWVAKCYEEFKRGSIVVALIPARTDSRYFHDYIAECADVFMLKGRLHFGDGENGPAPFPSAIVVWGAEPELIAKLSRALKEAWHIPSRAARAEVEKSNSAVIPA